MKKILFKIGEPVANVSNLTSVIATNATPNNLQAQDNTTKKPEIDIMKVAEGIAQANPNLLNDIDSKIIDKKMSSTKLVNSLTDSNLSELKNSVLNHLEKTGVITENQKNIALNSDKTIVDSKLKQGLKKEFIKIKKEFKKNDALTKEFNKKLSVKYTDVKNGYKVNIIEGEVNSKTIYFKIAELEEKMKKFAEFKKNVDEVLLKQEELLKNLRIALIAAAATVVTLSVMSFLPFVNVFAISALPWASAVSTALSIAVNSQSFNVDRIRKVSFSSKRLLEIYGNENKVITAAGIASLGFSVSNAFGTLGKLSSLSIEGLMMARTLKDSVKFIQTFAGKITVVGGTLDVFTLITTSFDLAEQNKRIDKIKNVSSDIGDEIIRLGQLINNYKKVEWVVIDETPQTDYYNNGGHGGRNLVFKNLETNEIKTLGQMLNEPEWKLKLWRLAKVYNSKLGIWYIKKLPNSIKEDNLG
ncbi:hypothetical protein [Mycoplasmopsis columboralis]|uniref:Uncharacterized protein n=1 Tax=Mycoplasmopsis columboralis TaxID=171282 RepID=A0A449B6H3_9BACT|nr:hypothetical protein [Mycoplasmopsis columboralis]VEU76203.1 Uncharacterised protein [Mycoplasmopsis columboralis]